MWKSLVHILLFLTGLFEINHAWLNKPFDFEDLSSIFETQLETKDGSGINKIRKMKNELKETPFKMTMELFNLFTCPTDFMKNRKGEDSEIGTDIPDQLNPLLMNINEQRKSKRNEKIFFTEMTFPIIPNNEKLLPSFFYDIGHKEKLDEIDKDQNYLIQPQSHILNKHNMKKRHKQHRIHKFAQVHCIGQNNKTFSPLMEIFSLPKEININNKTHDNFGNAGFSQEHRNNSFPNIFTSNMSKSEDESEVKEKQMDKDENNEFENWQKYLKNMKTVILMAGLLLVLTTTEVIRRSKCTNQNQLFSRYKLIEHC